MKDGDAEICKKIVSLVDSVSPEGTGIYKNVGDTNNGYSGGISSPCNAGGGKLPASLSACSVGLLCGCWQQTMRDEARISCEI